MAEGNLQIVAQSDINAFLLKGVPSDLPKLRTLSGQFLAEGFPLGNPLPSGQKLPTAISQQVCDNIQRQPYHWDGDAHFCRTVKAAYG